MNRYSSFVDGQSTRPSPPSLRRRGRGEPPRASVGMALCGSQKAAKNAKITKIAKGEGELGVVDRDVSNQYLKPSALGMPASSVNTSSYRRTERRPKSYRLLRCGEALMDRSLFLAVLVILAILVAFLEAVSLHRISVAGRTPSATMRAARCVAGSRPPPLTIGQRFIASDPSRQGSTVNGRS
jgi:hypothetical protein